MYVAPESKVLFALANVAATSAEPEASSSTNIEETPEDEF